MKPVQLAVLGLGLLFIGAVGVGLVTAQKKNGGDTIDQIAAPKEIRDALSTYLKPYLRG